MSRGLSIALWALAFAAAATPAWALPVGVVAGFLGIASATSFVAIAATFIVNTAISFAINLGINKLFGPKLPSSLRERQASVLQLSMGDTPREALFGECANAGTFGGGFNYGGEHGTDWVVKVQIVADHKCAGLPGFYVNDKFETYVADGPVAGYNGQLEAYWRDGSAGQVFPEALMAAWRASPIHSAMAPASDTPFTSQAYVVFAYKADDPKAENPVWPGGHPQFLPVVKGKLCYDPRKDPSVGGSALPDKAALFFALDCSTSMAGTKLATLKAAMSAVMAKIADAADAGGEYDIGAGWFGNAGGAIHRRAVTASTVGEVDAWIQALTATALNTNFRIGADLAEDFFTGTGGDFTDRRLYFLTDGFPTFGSEDPADIAADAAATISGLTPSVASYGVNIELADTTYTEMIDNTPGDGVPVIAPDDPEALADAIDLGGGAHSWFDPDTWEWTDNPIVCRYNWVRGIFAHDLVSSPQHLLVGRGLSATEAPPERVFAPANVCDELVDDGAEGLEKRYRMDGVIRSTDQFLAVEEMIAACVAGQIVQPEGGVEVIPGQARAPVFNITDDDLVVSFPVRFNAFGSVKDRINTLVPLYVEPAQMWQAHGAPVVRDEADVIADGGPHEEQLNLALVKHTSQAQRVGRIRYNERRREASGIITLGPRFAELEEGDWIVWTSARHTGGEPLTFMVKSFELDAGWRNTVALDETDFDVYGFGVPIPPGELPPGYIPGALQLTGVDAFGINLEGTSGSRLPAVRFLWDTPVDLAMHSIRAEIRQVDHLQVAPTTIENPQAGEADTSNGVGPGMLLEGRLIPVGPYGRAVVPSDWILISSYDLTEAGIRQFLWTIPLNLHRFDAQQPLSGSVTVLDPFLDFGDQQMALAIAGGSPGDKIKARNLVHDPTGPDWGRYNSSFGYVYAYQFLAVTTDAAGSILRLGFRDEDDNPVTDLSGDPRDAANGMVCNVTTTPQLFTWVFMSEDPAFQEGGIIIYDEPGDIAGGETVTGTDFRLCQNAGVSVFRPSPDEDRIERYIPLILELIEAERRASARQRLTVTRDGRAFEYTPPGISWSPEIAGTAYTVTPDAIGAMLVATNAALTTITLPADADAAIKVGAAGSCAAEGTGLFVYVAGAGAEVSPLPGGIYGATEQYEVVQWVKRAPNKYKLV